VLVSQSSKKVAVFLVVAEVGTVDEECRGLEDRNSEDATLAHLKTPIVHSFVLPVGYNSVDQPRDFRKGASFVKHRFITIRTCVSLPS